jgi:hypothetical protein
LQYSIIFKIKREGVWEDKSQFVQLPINIKETLDDTMDTAEVILGLTDDSHEYEAWDDVDLTITVDNSLRNYFMVVQKDRVEEVQLGFESKWTHKLTLIEATQKLSTLQTNDFAITQPLEVVVSPIMALRDDITNVFSTNNIHNGTVISGEKSFPNYNNWNSLGVIVTGSRTSGTFLTQNVRGISAAFNFQISRPSSLILKEYDSEGSTIQIPNLPTGTFEVGFGNTLTSNIFNWSIESSVTTRLSLSFHDVLMDMTTNTNVTNLINRNTNRVSIASLVSGRTYRYYVRTGSNTNGVFWDNPLNNSKLDVPITIVSNFTSPLAFAIYTNTTPRNILATPSNIGIVYAVGYSNSGNLIPTINASTLKPYEYYYEFKVEDGIITEGYFVDDSIIKAVDSTVSRRLEDYKFFFPVSIDEYFAIPEEERFFVRAVFPTDFYSYIGTGARNFGLGGGIQFVEFPPGSENASRNVYYKVKSLLAEGFVNLPNDADRNFSSGTYSTKKLDYEIDGDILDYVSNIPSPEFTFAGGKNLLEILFEIGKTFNGIPRLKLVEGKEIISFDILSKKIKDNTGFDHGSNPIAKESDSDNYATGLVSIVDNAINDEAIIINSAFYPSRNDWIKPKSKDLNESIFDLSNMAVVIENENSGIHRIISVKVRNFNFAGNIADISNLVVDKKIYNSLEPSISARGRHLYYEQGKNFIDGLSYLPNKDEVVAALGDKYAIQLAIESLGFVTSSQKPIADYEFQIEYVPVFNNLRLFSEQSKVITEKKRVFNAFSQPERNTSLLQYGENADIILKRTGVNSISSTYLIVNPVELPFIGEELVDNGFTYYADNITYVYDNQNITTNVNYTRDINKLDKFVGYNKNYREYQLYGENYIWKQKNINKYCYITKDNPIFPKEFSGDTSFRESVKSLFSGTNFPVKLDLSIIQFFDVDGRKLKYRFQNEDYIVPNIILNTLSGYTNNSMFFVNSMSDNYSAGNTLERITMNNNNRIDFGQELNNFLQKTSIQQVAILRGLENQLVVRDENQDGFEDNRKRLNAVRYVNSFGNADVMMVSYHNSGTISIGNEFPKLFATDSFNGTKNVSDLVLKDVLPINKMLETIYIDKDNRDALQQVMQVHFVSKVSDISVLSPFVKYNRLIANSSVSDQQTTLDYTGRLVLVGIKDIKKAIDEKRVDYKPADLFVTNINLQNSTDNYTAVMPNYGFNPTENYEGYGFVYQNTKELAIVYSKPLTANVFEIVPPIYFNFSDNPI